MTQDASLWKPVIHYEIPKTFSTDVACGIRWFGSDLRIIQTDNREKVTCKRCKQTRLWKKGVSMRLYNLRKQLDFHRRGEARCQAAVDEAMKSLNDHETNIRDLTLKISRMEKTYA